MSILKHSPQPKKDWGIKHVLSVFWVCILSSQHWGGTAKVFELDLGFLEERLITQINEGSITCLRIHSTRPGLCRVHCCTPRASTRSGTQYMLIQHLLSKEPRMEWNEPWYSISSSVIQAAIVSEKRGRSNHDWEGAGEVSLKTCNLQELQPQILTEHVEASVFLGWRLSEKTVS